MAPSFLTHKEAAEKSYRFKWTEMRRYIGLDILAQTRPVIIDGTVVDQPTDTPEQVVHTTTIAA